MSQIITRKTAQAKSNITNNQNIIKFPVDWSPYQFQLPLWRYLYNGGKTAIAVWHRRSGKDIIGINWITAAALQEVGTYWYVYPTYKQAQKAIWHGMTIEGRPYMSFIPEAAVRKVLKSEQMISFKNGSIIQFVGSDRHETLRGVGIKGAVISEYSYHDPIAITSLIEPMVARSNAWVLYLYTPAIDPQLIHGEELYLKHKDNPQSYCEIKTIEDTWDHEGNPLYKQGSFQSLSMNMAERRRELYCDFEAYKYKRADEGGTFIQQLRLAEIEGRITYVPHDPAYKVNTYWDTGVVDYTAIWFVQEKHESINIIDFYINRGERADFYLKHLSRRPYSYGRNILPHDINQRRWPVLDNRLQQANEIAESLGFAPFELGRSYNREASILQAQKLLTSSYCFIDEKKCREGINGLYEFEASKRKTHSSSTKCVDITDSFRYLAMDVKTGKEKESFGVNYLRYNKVVGDYNPFIVSNIISNHNVVDSDYNALEM